MQFSLFPGVERGFDWGRYGIADAVAEGGYVRLGQSGGVDGVVEVDGYGGRPEHPVAGAVMLERADQANGDDRDADLLGQAEAAVLKFINTAIPGAFRFRKDDQTGAAIDGFLGEAPHALDVRGAADVGDGDIAETLHEPAVGGNFEMGLEFPAADELRDRAVKDERVKEIYVIDHEETGAIGVEAGRANDFYARTGEKRDAATEGALQPVVLAHVDEDVEEDEEGRGNEKMNGAENP